MSASHFDESGRARMVDVGNKEETDRAAVACCSMTMLPETLRVILEGGTAKKGNPLETARLAGIMAAKKTWDLIPLCHPIQINSVEIDIEPDEPSSSLRIRSRVKTKGRTGVEMEALTAASVAALTVYDMVKSMDRGVVISGLRLLEKTGGKSGTWRAED